MITICWGKKLAIKKMPKMPKHSDECRQRANKISKKINKLKEKPKFA